MRNSHRLMSSFIRRGGVVASTPFKGGRVTRPGLVASRTATSTPLALDDLDNRCDRGARTQDYPSFGLKPFDTDLKEGRHVGGLARGHYITQFNRQLHVVLRNEGGGRKAGGGHSVTR